MSKHILMKDEAFAPMLYAVEKRLAELDSEAAAQGVTLTDSNARSIYVRTANIAKGKSPAGGKNAAATANAKDAFLDRAVAELTKVRDSLAEEHDLPDGGAEQRPLRASLWIDILGCLKESCEIRTGSAPGSRDYLDYIKGFIGTR